MSSGRLNFLPYKQNLPLASPPSPVATVGPSAHFTSKSARLQEP